jgi:hypothetical protein
MSPSTARKILTMHLEDPIESAPSSVQKALKAIGGSPELLADYEKQKALDNRARKNFADAEVPAEVEHSLAASVEAFPTRRFHPRDPAFLAAALGFLLLVVLIVWNFLGRPAVFPPDAAEIAETVIEVQDELFDEVGEPAGEVEDWFLMKGFDGFKVPEHLAANLAESGGILKVQNQNVAVVVVPGRDARFVVFEAAPFGIEIPDGEWRTARIDDLHSAAIRQLDGMCFMIVRRGSLASVQDLLGAANR